MLDFQRMDVYLTTRQLNRTLSSILKRLKGRGDWVDQARRAGASVALNLAEASGRYLPGEKATYYRYSKGSTFECMAVLDLLVDDGLLTEGEIRPAGELCERIAAMLVKLILNQESRGVEEGRTRTRLTRKNPKK